MTWQGINNRAMRLLTHSLRTTHGRIVACGVLVGLFYLPTWFHLIWRTIVAGSSSSFLNMAFFGLAIYQLWQQRQSLNRITANEEDRIVGYLVTLGGVVFFPFCLFSATLQTFICMLILGGIILSTWGGGFFRRNLLPMTLLFASLYPDYVFLSNTLWRFFTPPNLLDNWMAWLSSLALNAIGQSAVSNEAVVTLPGGSVLVGSGCNGFDMAFTLAGSGLVLGLFFQQNWRRILLLMGVGVVLALVFNVPRIMLLTIADVYWGKSVFEFWHGPIGGQIFATGLFTIYYYIFMGLLSKPSKSK